MTDKPAVKTPSTPVDAQRKPIPPIAEYGFLSNCEVTALIAASGNVEWMCLPRMDSPSVFAAILDRGAGRFRLGPADVTVPSGRRYLPGTMVLETTWATPTGWAVVRDVLLVGTWPREPGRSTTHRRVPVDHKAERMLLRTVRCLNGSIDFLLECEPAFDYGRQRGTGRYTGDGYGQAEVAADGEPRVRLTTDLNLGFEGPRAIARHRLRAGDKVFCALSWGTASRPRPSPRRTSGWPARRTTGTGGSAGATSLITRGASTCSGPR